VGYCVHQDGRAGGQDQWFFFLELKFRQKFKKKKNPDVKIM
jgi:hypothetical protein